MRFPLARVLSGAVLVGVLAACSDPGEARIGRAAGPGARAVADGQRPSTGTTGPGADLLALLVPYPAGAEPWTKSKTGVLDLDEFVDIFYTSKNRATTRARVVSDGFRTAVRHGWFNADGSQEDVWLVRFASSDGARSEYLSVTDNWKNAAKPTTTFAVPAIHGLGELVPTSDSLGNTSAKAAASRGDLFLYARVFTKQPPEQPAVTHLAQEQYAILPG